MGVREHVGRLLGKSLSLKVNTKDKLLLLKELVAGVGNTVLQPDARESMII